MDRNLQRSISKMVDEISGILLDCEPSIYLYGSVVLDDFRFGWSDIDILVLTQMQMTEGQAQELVQLRQTMLDEEPGDPHYRSFEGGMLTLYAFLHGNADRVVYWGTSGERITDRYVFDCFGMAELMESGILLFGTDVRSQLKVPAFEELYEGVRRHYEAIRQYARQTDRSIYSFGWMLDIARCIYTLCTGKIIAKTAAAEWVLENKLCPEPNALEIALKVRKDPLILKEDETYLEYAETLAEPIRRFADVLERELVLAHK